MVKIVYNITNIYMNLDKNEGGCMGMKQGCNNLSNCLHISYFGNVYSITSNFLQKPLDAC